MYKAITNITKIKVISKRLDMVVLKQ